MNREAQIESMTILLVEDHPDTREAMNGWFKRRGYTVLEACDMKSALGVGGKTPFDLLICDLKLPDGDGWQLLQKLRPKRKIVSVAMSGHSAPADVARSKMAGFFAHLIKPFRIEELESMLSSTQREVQRLRASALRRGKK
jgi:CheY-like chemotaxis protein